MDEKADRLSEHRYDRTDGGLSLCFLDGVVERVHGAQENAVGSNVHGSW